MKNKNKLFVYDIPAIMQYKIYAKNERMAKKILIEEAGHKILGEPIFIEDDFRNAEPMEQN
jgi:hypothetical protein